MNSSFRARIVSAGLWTAGGFAAQRVLQLASNLVLTRLLYPEAFGLMALANVFLIGLAMFSDVGIKPAIIQSEHGEDIDFLNTAWTIQVVRGFLLWLGACAVAYPAAVIYRQPLLWPIVSVLGLTSIISGFSSISLATSERRLRIKRLTVVQFCGQAISLTITVALAWILRSVWAFVYGALIGSTVAMILSHVFLPHHPHRLTWQNEIVNSLVRFGRWIFFSTALTFLAGQGLRMLQGLLLAASELGVLSIAQTMAAIPVELVQQIVAMAVFPALSEARQVSHAKMVDVLGKLHGKLMTLAVVAFSGMALVSVPVIHLLYDARYQDAGPQLALLSFAGCLLVMMSTYQNALLAMGDSRMNAIMNLASTLARIAGLLIGFELGGIPGMLLGIAAGSLVAYLYLVWRCRSMGLIQTKVDTACLAAIAGLGLAVAALYSGPIIRMRDHQTMSELSARAAVKPSHAEAHQN